jgi:hypothetical protein
MRKEKVATMEVLERKNKKTLYLYRNENWVYTLENEQGVIKTFETEEAPVNSLVPVYKTSIEGYLKEFEDKIFPTPCLIIYEVEYKNVGDLGYELGFKSLKEWYEEHLTYLTPELFRLLHEDFVKASWQILMQHYKESREYRKILNVERYFLKEVFGSVLMFVKMCLSDNREIGLRIAENLYGKSLRDWLAETVENLPKDLFSIV